MLSTNLTKGTLAALMFVVLATVATVAAAGLGGVGGEGGNAAPGSTRHPRPTPSPTPTGWQKGPKFSTETKCYTYGYQQVWPLWECRREGAYWRYRYWTAGATISPLPLPKSQQPR